MMYTQEQQDDYSYFPFYQDTLPPKPPSPQHHYSETPSHEESVPSYCVLCDKEFNSEFQSRQHFAGKVHKRKQVAALNKGNVPPVSAALQKPIAFTTAQ